MCAPAASHRGCCSCSRCSSPAPRSAAANQEWAILAALLVTLLLAPALRKPLFCWTIFFALRTSDDELSHRALHDPLTGLANRRCYRPPGHALSARDHGAAPSCSSTSTTSRRSTTPSATPPATSAARGRRRLRSCFGPSDTVARLGGDEFAVLVEDLAEPHGATSVAERILLDALAPARPPRAPRSS